MQMRTEALSLTAIHAARQRLAGRVPATPLRLAPRLSERCGRPVYLKLESHQHTGSFKLRGATHALLARGPAACARGVVTASTGNHGRALAHAAAAEGLRAVICLSALVPANKVEAVRATGAQVHQAGSSQDDALREAARLAADDGLALVQPFDDPDVIAGQGTIGLEILEQLPEVDTVLVPLSGGGLLGGVGLALGGSGQHVRVVGVSMARGAAMHASLQAGRPVEVTEEPTLADSLGGGIGLDNVYTYDLVRRHADAVELVDEDAIADAIRWAWREEREVLEGAAAVGIAAVLQGRVPRGGGPVVLVLSGRNIDPALHARLLEGGHG